MGLVVGLAVALTTVMVLALPLFGLASALEPRRGTGRSFIQTGLTVVVLPAAVIVGAAVGAGTTRWHHRGGRLPS